MLRHPLAVSVARRGEEMALLKGLGFRKCEVASVVGRQATTLTLVGIGVGVPVGVIIGQAVWTAFAGNLGAVPGRSNLASGSDRGCLIVANLIAIRSALVAPRPKVRDLLRTK
jgi:ABC-type lipoprotein release transport system permease subunit